MNDLPFDVAAIRAQFPALARTVGGRPAVFFDGPAGSQVPGRVIDAVARYLRDTNANTHGDFDTSRESDAVLDKARAAVADLLGAADPDCVAFGANMTTLTLSLARALGRTWGPGDEVVVTRLDHDANVWPWVLAARDAGATVRHAGLRPDDCTLDLDDLRRQLGPRTRLVAVAAASNAVGTFHPVAAIAAAAHAVGAEVFVDAVHHAPHALIDVSTWDCDYLACSAYKFFGPHVGALWGRRDRLASLPAYRVRPAGDELPGRWMTGTQNHEGIAGTGEAVAYLADLGRAVAPAAGTRREALRHAFAAIAAYERLLGARLLAGLAALPAVRVWGITAPERLAERAPTFAITARGHRPAAIAAHLAGDGIFVWHGNFYAVEATTALGLEPDGVVRIGLLHYNTAEEVDRLLASLGALLAAP